LLVLISVVRVKIHAFLPDSFCDGGFDSVAIGDNSKTVSH